MIRRLLGPTIQLSAVLRPEAGNILIDPTQLEQAIVNLCVNGRDAMPEGGSVDIETGRRLAAPGIPSSAIRVCSRTTGPHGRAPLGLTFVAVSDTGAGNPPGDPRPDLRAVLHHQGGRPGHGARPVDRVRDRPQRVWRHHGRVRARPRHPVLAHVSCLRGRRRGHGRRESRRPSTAPRRCSSWRMRRPSASWRSESWTEHGYRVLSAANAVGGARAVGRQRGREWTCSCPTSRCPGCPESPSRQSWRAVPDPRGRSSSRAVFPARPVDPTSRPGPGSCPSHSAWPPCSMLSARRWIPRRSPGTVVPEPDRSTPVAIPGHLPVLVGLLGACGRGWMSLSTWNRHVLQGGSSCRAGPAADVRESVHQVAGLGAAGPGSGGARLVGSRVGPRIVYWPRREGLEHEPRAQASPGHRRRLGIGRAGGRRCLWHREPGRPDTLAAASHPQRAVADGRQPEPDRQPDQ